MACKQMSCKRESNIEKMLTMDIFQSTHTPIWLTHTHTAHEIDRYVQERDCKTHQLFQGMFYKRFFCLVSHIFLEHPIYLFFGEKEAWYKKEDESNPEMIFEPMINISC